MKDKNRTSDFSADKMILFVASDTIPHVGGKSSHILDLIDGLHENCIEAKLVSQGQFDRKFKIAIKLLLFPLYLTCKPLFVYCYNLIWAKILAKKVLKECRRHHFEAISIQDAFAAYALRTVKNKIQFPMILTMHTYFGLENKLDKDKNSGIIQRIYQRNLEKELISLSIVDKVIAVDLRIKEHVETTVDQLFKQGVLKNKPLCTSIENFTNTNIFSPCDNKDSKNDFLISHNLHPGVFIVICARRLVEKNGVIFAVKAIEKVNSNVVLLLAGDGPQYEAINDYIKEHDLYEKVIFLGSLSSKQMKEIYQVSDVALVPSITVNGLQEATSISALESMSCGLPTIASNIGGLKQLINCGENGLLCDECNYEQIADAIEKLMSDDKLYRDISNKARISVVENHSHIQGAVKYYYEFTGCQIAK